MGNSHDAVTNDRQRPPRGASSWIQRGLVAPSARGTFATMIVFISVAVSMSIVRNGTQELMSLVVLALLGVACVPVLVIGTRILNQTRCRRSGFLYDAISSLDVEAMLASSVKAPLDLSQVSRRSLMFHSGGMGHATGRLQVRPESFTWQPGWRARRTGLPSLHVDLADVERLCVSGALMHILLRDGAQIRITSMLRKHKIAEVLSRTTLGKRWEFGEAPVA